MTVDVLPTSEGNGRAKSSVAVAIYEWLDIYRLGFAVLFLALLIGITLFDPDYFWHLRTGQYIVEAGALPAGDPYSHTAFGKPWVLHEWLFEVLLYGAHAALGPLGVKLLCATFGVATAATMVATAKVLLGRPTYAYILAVTCYVVVAFGFSPRPQLATFLFFAVYFRVLHGFKHAGATSALWLLPALMVVWVNCHGGYVAGVALAVLFCVCEWIGYFFQPGNPEQKRRLRLLGVAVAATILATLVNPYFIDHWIYPFQLMGMEAVKTYISEWQSPNFHDPWPLAFLALVLVTFVAAMYRSRRPDLTEIAITGFFVTSGFIGLRHIPIAALTLLPFAAASLAQVALEKSAVAARLPRLLKPFGTARTARRPIGRRQFLLNWIMLAMLVAGGLLYYPLRHAKDADFVNMVVPVKATEFIRQTGLEGRMFNTYHYGGYLILQLYPAQRVFMDGRGDMYGDDLIKEYLEIVGGGADWQRLFDKHRVDYAIVERKAPLRQLLLCRGDYKLVYDDAAISILVKDVPRYAALVARYGPTVGDVDGGRCT